MGATTMSSRPCAHPQKRMRSAIDRGMRSVRPDASGDEADAGRNHSDDDEREVERRRPPVDGEIGDDAHADDDGARERQEPAEDRAAIHEDEDDADEERDEGDSKWAIAAEP